MWARAHSALTDNCRRGTRTPGAFLSPRSRRAQGTLTGWSGDVVPAAERKRLVARLDALAAHISAMKKT
jgi:hypothetical protein